MGLQVTGFSVGGRVVDGNNMGVDGVKIIVDGQEKSITDKEGFYKLDQVMLFHERDFYMKCFSTLSRTIELILKCCTSN